jgi:preflagellin peptidase FlaK
MVVGLRHHGSYREIQGATITPKPGAGDHAGVQAAIPDLLRLVAVPVLGWAAVRDVRTRRVPNGVWWPLAVLGLGLVVWEAYQLWTGPFGAELYLLRVAISIGVVVPLSYAFWFLGGFGGADAKAFMVLALLFPTYPTYELLGRAWPLVVTDLGVFSLSVLTNTVLVGLAFPLALGIRNLLSGNVSWVMFLGHRVPVAELPRRHGTLLETPSGITTGGLDLDALRMYLRWRGLDLETVRANPGLVDPETLPAKPNDPTDGAVAPDGGVPGGAASADGPGASEADTPGSGAGAGDLDEWEWIDVDAPDVDRWGAEAFLEDIDSSAYGTTPGALRDGLDVLVRAETVWVSPGVPFIVPTFVGLLVALSAGDILFLALRGVGLVGP